MDKAETVDLTTPSGKKVVLRSYITGRIKQAIDSVLKFETTGNGKAIFDGANTIAGINKAIEELVVSVEGKTDNVLDAVLEMAVKDYEFIRDEVQKVQRPLASTTETNSTIPITTTSPASPEKSPTPSSQS